MSPDTIEVNDLKEPSEPRNDAQPSDDVEVKCAGVKVKAKAKKALIAVVTVCAMLVTAMISKKEVQQ